MCYYNSQREWALPMRESIWVCNLLCLNWILWGGLHPKVSKENYSQEPSVLNAKPECATAFQGTWKVSCLKNMSWLCASLSLLNSCNTKPRSSLRSLLTFPSPWGPAEPVTHGAWHEATSGSAALIYPRFLPVLCMGTAGLAHTFIS